MAEAATDLQQKRYRWHGLLLGTEPEADQKRLYDAFPDRLGFADRTLDERRFEATLILATALAQSNEHVLLLSPQLHERWVLKQMDAVISSMFARCKQLDGNDRVQVAQRYAAMFGRIFIAHRVLQMKEPTRWVSFGFAAADVLPPWMEGRLLV